MKKNLITVIILALCLINLVFNILLVFVYMPSASKTNKLITDIAAVLDLEIESQSNGENNFDVGDLAHFELPQTNPINLAADGTDTKHVIQYGLTIDLDSKAKDYDKISANLENSTALIYDMVRNIIGQYTYNQVIDVKIQKEIKDEILLALRETFNTECIYSVSFYNWVAQ
ncbi:MAG: flagellar basal body-associated FliL family protein [Wujia sp.]